jgi:hypothetical protein
MIAVFWMLLGPTRVETGCLTCELHEEVGEGGTLLYLEEWETPEHLERHISAITRWGRPWASPCSSPVAFVALTGRRLLLGRRNSPPDFR